MVSSHQSNPQVRTLELSLMAELSSGPSPWGASEGRAPQQRKVPPDAQVEYNDNFIGKPIDFNHVE